MLLHKITKEEAQEESLGGFCPCAAWEGPGDADPGDCVSLNPSFHCSKAEGRAFSGVQDLFLAFYEVFSPNYGISFNLALL